MRILVADDDLVSRCLLTTVLKKAGHEVVEAADGSAAWQTMCQPDAPHMVILDWQMPGFSGLELCRKIRAQEGAEYTYVVLQTGRGSAADVQTGFEAGADDYLIKPVDMQQLLQRIRAAARALRHEARIASYAANMERLAEERAKQLVHADRMVTLGVLAAGIAHEINNPATFIAGNVQTMERVWGRIVAMLAKTGVGAEDPMLAMARQEFPEMMADIRNGVVRITTIVQGLKRFARQEQGSKAPFSVAEACGAALRLCQNRLKHQITVSLEVSEALPRAVGNVQQIEQVLVNLLVNAADAMEAQGQGTLQIRAFYEPPCIRVAVYDSGPGLPAAVLDRMFDPFFTTKQADKGTGLGLPISRGIIEEHGGVLRGYNQAGGGASFEFTLPVVDGGAQAPAP
jgi:signal transduction histidine kinase